MKKIVFAAFLAANASVAMAAPGDTDDATGAASATIIAPISVTHDSDVSLNFGTIAVDSEGGTVQINASGTVVEAGTTAAVLSDSSTSADAFDVSGDADRAYSITATDGTLSGAGDDMAFVTALSKTSGTLDGGSDSFTVGGTLTVAGDQAAGDYTGDYTVTVSYD